MIMTMGVKDQGYSEDHLKWHPFEFEWLYPDKDGFEQLQVRLRDLLRKPAKEFASDYMFHAMLKIPEVTRAVSVKDFLAALELYQGPRSSYDRQGVLEYLNKNSEQVTGYFERRIEADDPSAARDLLQADKIWSPALSDLLLRYCERNPQSADAAIRVFFFRGVGKPADPAVARRLSSAWLKTASLLSEQPENLPLAKRAAWAEQVETLGRTRDVKMIPRLQALLDDKVTVWDEAEIRYLETPGIPNTRACDVAMAAILAILGRNGANVSADVRVGGALGAGTVKRA